MLGYLADMQLIVYLGLYGGAITVGSMYEDQ